MTQAHKSIHFYKQIHFSLAAVARGLLAVCLLTSLLVGCGKKQQGKTTGSSGEQTHSVGGDSSRKDSSTASHDNSATTNSSGAKGNAIARGTGELKVVYYPAKSKTAQELQQIYQKTRVFELMGNVIDQRIALPRDIPIEIGECGFENAFYDPKKHRIVMCYELTQYFIKLYKSAGMSDRQAGENAMYATIFTFFHESGHMLAHELQLPITGREEDAADQFSTLILATRSGKAGEKAAEAAALWFALAAKPANRNQFMDEHSLDQQRFYAIMCLLYGDNPEKYEPTVRKLRFSDARLQRCRQEYAQTARAWKALLAPYIKEKERS